MVRVDAGEAPELREWADDLGRRMQTWYPQIVGSYYKHVVSGACDQGAEPPIERLCI